MEYRIGRGGVAELVTQILVECHPSLHQLRRIHISVRRSPDRPVTARGRSPRSWRWHCPGTATGGDRRTQLLLRTVPHDRDAHRRCRRVRVPAAVPCRRHRIATDRVTRRFGRMRCSGCSRLARSRTARRRRQRAGVGWTQAEGVWRCTAVQQQQRGLDAEHHRRHQRMQREMLATTRGTAGAGVRNMAAENDRGSGNKVASLTGTVGPVGNRM